MIARANIFFKQIHTESMKKLNFKIICAAIIMLSVPLAGCASKSNAQDNKGEEKPITREMPEEQPQEEQPEDKCPDGQCPEFPDIKRRNRFTEPPIGRIPKRRGDHMRRRPLPLPAPIDRDKN